jgi:hypothetical protein
MSSAAFDFCFFPSFPMTTLTADRVFDAVFDATLDFQIEMPFEDACQFIHRIDQYNDFDAHKVIAALHRVDQIIPRKQYGESNPNNGKRDFNVSVGREGSPVIYIRLTEIGSHPKMTDYQMKTVVAIMREHGIADEADFEVRDGLYGRFIEFRFWWD